MLKTLMRALWRPSGPAGGARSDSPAPDGEDAAAGLARFAAGDHAGAERAFRMALARDPGDPLLHLNLASALCAQGRLFDAVPHARAAWRGAPGNPDCRECLRFTCANLGLDEATPDGADAWSAAIATGNRERTAGDRDVALGACERALALAQDDPFTHGRIGAALCALGRHAQATPHLQAAGRAGLMPDAMFDLSDDALRSLVRAAPARDPSGAAAEGARPALVLSFSCDSAYFHRYAHALAQSVARHAGMDLLMHFHLVNPDAGVDAVCERIQRDFPGLAVALEKEVADLSRYALPKAWYACARYARLPGLLRRHACPVLVLDLDMRLQGPLAPLCALLAGVDFAVPLVADGRGEPGEILSASCTWFAPTPGGLAVADLVAAYIEREAARGRMHWFLEQIALLAAWTCVRDGLIGARARQLDAAIIHGAREPGASGEPALSGLFWTEVASLSR